MVLVIKVMFHISIDLLTNEFTHIVRSSLGQKLILITN